MTNPPKPDVEEIKALAEADHRGRTPHAKDVLALIAYIEALEARQEKLDMFVRMARERGQLENAIAYLDKGGPPLGGGGG